MMLKAALRLPPLSFTSEPRRSAAGFAYWVTAFLIGGLAVAGCSAESDPAGGKDPLGGGPGPSASTSSENGPGLLDDENVIEQDEREASLPPYNCGDGILGRTENCDDGNTVGGDGCSADCKEIEEGFHCPHLGFSCEAVPYCGDGQPILPETCDDGNAQGGDGCSEVCQIEDGWACPDPGAPCQYVAICGNGVRQGREECDDGGEVSGDGCSSDCTVEAGYECPIQGAPCIPLCGDGILTATEECDDGNTTPGDGCSPTCKFEIGWVCTPGQGCRPTVCGDGVVEGAEGCDDQNNHLGDGCSPDCVLEPKCDTPDGTCTSECGDGLLLGDFEECDDGNRLSGDGCDENCHLEAGWQCPTVREADSGTVRLPVVYRDFKGIGPYRDPGHPGDWNCNHSLGPQIADGHPDFENMDFSINTPKVNVTSTEGQTFSDVAGPTRGLVNTQLGEGQTGALRFKPSLRMQGGQITSAQSFSQWYDDVPGVNLTVRDVLVLNQAGPGLFAFERTEFFPLDGLGFTQPGNVTEPNRSATWLKCNCGVRQANGEWRDVQQGQSHNYSFTSEVRFWFEYQGGEQLVFRGDDDVWVYIKRRLVVDLGGNHEPFGGDVCGNIWSGIEVQPQCAGLQANTTDVDGQSLDLEIGRVYEAVVWQAERHTCQSNYRLTLSNFARQKSECTPICGDGIVTGFEACDDGLMNGAGYGFCSTDCTPGPRCGDGNVDTDVGEECDNGANLDPYYNREDACGPGCKFPSFCGDGVVDTAFGEQCDFGREGNTGEYLGCTMDCKLGPFCGDGVRNEPEEECDDGNRANNDGCSVVCTNEPIHQEREAH